MNKIRKFKSKFWKSALILSPTFPVAFLAAACNTKSEYNIFKSKIYKPQTENPLRFNTEIDDMIDFRVIFYENDPRTKALSKVLQKWNEKTEVKNKKPGFLPAKLDNSYTNYQNDQNALASYIQAKENKKLPNLTLNYPALAATLNKFGMLLDLNTQKELEEKIKSEYDEKFLSETKNLPGISPDRIPFLPILKTSKVLLVDKPVLSYILESAKKSSPNFKILASDQKIVENLDLQKTDLEYIKRIWGGYKNISFNENGFDGYTFSFSKLNNFAELVDFLSRVKKSFPEAEKGSQTEKVDFLIGFNDVAATLFFTSFAEANGEYLKSSYFRDRDENKNIELLNYTNLFNNKTKNYQNTKKAYEIMASLIKNKLAGPWTWNRGYASDYLKNHQLVFALTSSSHYTRNFEKIGQVFLRFKFPNSQKDYPVGSNSRIWKLVSDENLPPNAIAKIHQILDNKPGYVYVGNQSQISENDISLDQINDKNLIQEVKNTIKIKANLNNFSFLASDANFDKWLENNKKSDVGFANLNLEVSSKNKLKLIKQNPNIFLFSKSYEKLNEDELMALPEPQKLQNSNRFNIITSQGPSLIGFHNNEKEDTATLNFIKWFISEKEEFLDNNNQKIIVTPSDFLSLAAGNLNPTKTNLNSDFVKNPVFLQNPLFKIAFEQFKKTLENPEKYRFFAEPAGVDSNTFRISMQQTLGQINNQFHNNPQLDLNFDYFLEQLKKNIAILLNLNKKASEKTEKN
ncbi:hypothetical protein DR081_02850 [Mycoplasma sp. MF12]|nr:hypothetical protein [Mycoplasma sp. MF12]